MTRRWIFPLFALVFFFLRSLAAEAPPPLRVFAAASLSEVLPRIAEAWQREGGPRVLFTFDSTSRLAVQLQAAAPADVFFSADTRWMDDLSTRGLIRTPSRIDLLGNRLVVIVPSTSTKKPASAADLLTLEGKLALADENVPAGRYAREALKHAGVWEQLAPRVVGGDNVRTVLAWVARGEATAGIVYATDVRVEPRVISTFTFAEGSHTPIVYPAAVTTTSNRPEVAARFLTFCAGSGRAIFEQAGFTPITRPTP